MLYFSTRNKQKTYNFEQIFLNALADDGGLYVPKNIPKMSMEEINSMKDFSFQKMSYEIFKKFTGDTFVPKELEKIINKSYSVFRNKKIVDLKLIDNISCVELFHGPTLAFKDIAMQVLGNMYVPIGRSFSNGRGHQKKGLQILRRVAMAHSWQSRLMGHEMFVEQRRDIGRLFLNHEMSSWQCSES